MAELDALRTYRKERLMPVSELTAANGFSQKELQGVARSMNIANESQLQRDIKTNKAAMNDLMRVRGERAAAADRMPISDPGVQRAFAAAQADARRVDPMQAMKFKETMARATGGMGSGAFRRGIAERDAAQDRMKILEGNNAAAVEAAAAGRPAPQPVSFGDGSGVIPNGTGGWSFRGADKKPRFTESQHGPYLVGDDGSTQPLDNVIAELRKDFAGRKEAATFEPMSDGKGGTVDGWVVVNGTPVDFSKKPKELNPSMYLDVIEIARRRKIPVDDVLKAFGFDSGPSVNDTNAPATKPDVLGDQPTTMNGKNDDFFSGLKLRA